MRLLHNTLVIAVATALFLFLLYPASGEEPKTPGEEYEELFNSFVETAVKCGETALKKRPADPALVRGIDRDLAYLAETDPAVKKFRSKFAKAEKKSWVLLPLNTKLWKLTDGGWGAYRKVGAKGRTGHDGWFGFRSTKDYESFGGFEITYKIDGVENKEKDVTPQVVFYFGRAEGRKSFEIHVPQSEEHDRIEVYTDTPGKYKRVDYALCGATNVKGKEQTLKVLFDADKVVNVYHNGRPVLSTIQLCNYEYAGKCGLYARNYAVTVISVKYQPAPSESGGGKYGGEVDSFLRKALDIGLSAMAEGELELGEQIYRDMRRLSPGANQPKQLGFALDRDVEYLWVRQHLESEVQEVWRGRFHSTRRGLAVESADREGRAFALNGLSRPAFDAYEIVFSFGEAIDPEKVGWVAFYIAYTDRKYVNVELNNELEVAVNVGPGLGEEERMAGVKLEGTLDRKKFYTMRVYTDKRSQVAVLIDGKAVLTGVRIPGGFPEEGRRCIYAHNTLAVISKMKVSRK